MNTPKPADGTTVQVQQYNGQSKKGGRLFVPVRILDFLSTKSPLDFDVFHKTNDGHLQLLLEKGKVVSPEWRSEWEIRNPGEVAYVPQDQKEKFLLYQEKVLPEILDDPAVPLYTKCAAVQEISASISRRMFESPDAANIQRQKDNVFEMVDFALREPQAVRGLLKLTYHDYYTYTHSVNVGVYALTLALHLFKDDNTHNLHEVAAGFFLHDVGKSRIPSSIINKNGKLDASEWDIMRSHPTFGFEILTAEKHDSPEAVVIALQHHERLDGRGYPKGIDVDDLHLYARICSLADAYDALTTRRSYKEAMKPFEALAIMKEEVGKQFDPDMFSAFVLLMHGSQPSQESRQQSSAVESLFSADILDDM